MGTTISTISLLVGSLTSGTLSAMAANYAREQQFTQSKTYFLYCAVLAIFLILITMFIVIKSKISGAGIFEGFAIGITLAFVLLTIVLFVSLVMSAMGYNAANDNDSSDAVKYGAISAAICFLGFLISLLLILFLL